MEELQKKIEYAKKLNQAKEELSVCMNNSCKKVVINYKTILNNFKNNLKKLLNKYLNNKISEKKLLYEIINILNKNFNNIKYTNYIKCSLKNCYKNRKLYFDIAYSTIEDNQFIQKIILTKAKEYGVHKEVMRFLKMIKDQSTLQKIKLTGKLMISILEKLYGNNESLIVKTIKKNKLYIPIIIAKMNEVFSI